MAFFDWDGNGKNTVADDFIEYQIYKEVMGENDDDFAPRKRLKNNKVENPQFITTIFSDESKKDYSNPPSANVTILACIIVCILCFGGIGICVLVDVGTFGIILILAGAIGLSILVLKVFGVMR